MKTKSLVFTLACLLLFTVFAVPAIATSSGCYPPCGPCEECIDGHCVWVCSAGQNCCGGSCCSNICCNGVCCAAGQNCCNGSCCDKVWTKETVAGIAETCGSCNSSTGYCAGMIIDRQGYEKCLNVGVGQGGEHCQCNETMQVVGHIYLCTENWDVSKLLWCAFKCVCCAIQCFGPYADPASCSECLCSTQADCCGDECEVCDFVEECYPNPDALNEIQDLVFTGFGC